MSHDEVLDGHILNIVQSSEISEQVDLQGLLRQRGYDVAQATLSRRLKKLKIAKISGVYKVIDFAQPRLPLVLNAQASASGLVVLHTHPGHAHSLAYFFDQKYVDFSANQGGALGLLGTIAGDDTVLLITRNKRDLQKVLSLLGEIFPYLKIPTATEI